MAILGSLFSSTNYVYMVEGLVILSLVVYVGYLAHALKLFKKH